MAATLKCDTIQNASSSTANLTLDASGNATVGNTLAMGSSFKRNRIINGNMVIDQRNAGASVTATAVSSVTYVLDRYFYYATQASKFTVQQNAGSVTPPSGFKNYLGVTSSSAYTVTSTDQFVVSQRVEGFNVADFNWGTASALQVTLSFWVRSSLTGTFGGAINNGAYSRAYPFSYSIISANTWEYKTITISGDTTGTWASDNTSGLVLNFGLGCGSSNSGTAGAWAASGVVSATGATSVVGTNGATFYITGVQLEVGSIATPYERQIYSDQLAQCQRYAYVLTPDASVNTSNTFMGSTVVQSATASIGNVVFPVKLRSIPSLSYNASIGSYYVWFGANGNYQAMTSMSLNVVTGTQFASISIGYASTANSVAGQCGNFLSDNTGTGRITFSSEL